jgi:hypothetical protein
LAPGGVSSNAMHGSTSGPGKRAGRRRLVAVTRNDPPGRAARPAPVMRQRPADASNRARTSRTPETASGSPRTGRPGSGTRRVEPRRCARVGRRGAPPPGDTRRRSACRASPHAGDGSREAPAPRPRCARTPTRAGVEPHLGANPRGFRPRPTACRARRRTRRALRAGARPPNQAPRTDPRPHEPPGSPGPPDRDVVRGRAGHLLSRTQTRRIDPAHRAGDLPEDG